jgi:hypothetical protein
MSVSQEEPLTLRRIEQFVEELTSAYRQLVDGQQLSATANLRELLPIYAADILPHINDRIVECHALLKRGLRDEAIGRANDPPNLVLAANFLNLDRFGREHVAEWRGASDVVGLAWPADPRFDLLGDLVDAEVQVAELQPLLAKWRRLNIGRAPLPDRIAVLRKLHAHEERTSEKLVDVWRGLLATHEKFRFTEIKAALKRIGEQLGQAASTDTESLAKELRSLLEELQGDWTCEQPPKQLLELACRLEVQLREQTVDRELDRLAPMIEAAQAALADTTSDERPRLRDQLQMLVKQWHLALQDRGAIAPDDSRQQRVRAALDYVAHLTEANDLMLEVGHQVSDRPERYRHRLHWSRAIQGMMDRLDEAAMNLPEVDVDVDRITNLSERVARVAADVRREGSLRTLLLAGTVGVAVTAVMVLTWWSFDGRRHESLVADALAHLETETEQIRRGVERSLETIGGDWPDRVQRDPRTTAALERLRAEARAQEARRSDFQQLLDEARAAIAALQKAERPDPLAPWPAEFGKASQTLERLKTGGVAVTDQEKAALEGPAATLRAVATAYTQAADDALVAAAKAIEHDMSAIEVILPDDLAKADTMLDDIQKRLEALFAKTTTLACPSATAPHGTARIVSPAAAAAVSARSQLADAIGTLRRKRGVYAGLDAKEQRADELLASGDFAAYADALRDIAKELGNRALAKEYLATAEFHPHWKALLEWELLFPTLRAASRASSEEAKKLRTLLQGLPEETQIFSFIRDATGWIDPVLAEMETFSHDDLLAAADGLRWLLEGQYGTMIDGVVWEKSATVPRSSYYFLLRDRPLPNAARGARHVVRWPDERRVWEKQYLMFDPETHRVDDAPQKVIASRCLTLLDQLPETNTTGLAVDQFALDMLDACAKDDGEDSEGGIPIDPCIHALLMRYVLLDVCALSSFTKTELRRSLQFVEAGNAPDGQPIQIKGADNQGFKMVLDPATQHSEAIVLAARRAASEFVDSVRVDVKRARGKLDREMQTLADKHKALIAYACVGRLRRAGGGGWKISGGSDAQRQGKTVYAVTMHEGLVDVVPCATCDATGEIPAGTKIDAQAGQPVYVRLTIEEDR